MCKKEKNIEKLTYVQNRRKEVINKQCYSVPDKDIFHGVFVKSMQTIDISEIRQKIQIKVTTCFMKMATGPFSSYYWYSFGKHVDSSTDKQ